MTTKPQTVTVELDRGVAERTLSRCPDADGHLGDFLTVDQRTLRTALATALQAQQDQETSGVDAYTREQLLSDEVVEEAADAQRVGRSVRLSPAGMRRCLEAALLAIDKEKGGEDGN